jgi:hypothetical protein
MIGTMIVQTRIRKLLTGAALLPTAIGILLVCNSASRADDARWEYVSFSETVDWDPNDPNAGKTSWLGATSNIVQSVMNSTGARSSTNANSGSPDPSNPGGTQTSSAERRCQTVFNYAYVFMPGGTWPGDATDSGHFFIRSTAKSNGTASGVKDFGLLYSYGAAAFANVDLPDVTSIVGDTAADGWGSWNYPTASTSFSYPGTNHSTQINRAFGGSTATFSVAAYSKSMGQAGVSGGGSFHADAFADVAVSGPHATP